MRAACTFTKAVCINNVNHTFTYTGHLQGQWDVEDLLDAGLLDQVVYAYAVLKQRQHKKGAEGGGMLCGEAFLERLVGCSIHTCQEKRINVDEAKLHHGAPQWIKAATKAIVVCLGELLLSPDCSAHCDCNQRRAVD